MKTIAFNLALLFGLLTVACIKITSTPLPIVNSTAIDTSKKKFLALGDSYTIGQSVPKTDRFAEQTKQLLANQNIAFEPIEYIATTGWTTLNLESAIHAQNPMNNYTIVSLLIGVNDQYQTHDTTFYRTRFTNLLLKAIQLAGNKKEHVFVLSIPDYSVTPAVPASNKAIVSKEIDWFNEINKSVTLSFEVSYTDITISSREAANNAQLIASDGLHPSGLEYKKWAELLAPKIIHALK